MLAAGAVATAGAAVRAGRARARAIEAVDPALRSPALRVPASVRGPGSLRVGRRLIAAATTPVERGVELTERVVGGVRVLCYERPDRRRPSGAVVWLHGGGTVMGRPEQAHAFASHLASRLDVLVVNVDYRLAPEHPFPAALDDAVTALEWVHAAADELGVDRDRVAVGGDSAGGGLAAALAQRALDEGIPVSFQALVYPMLDDRTVLRADHGHRGRFVWTPTSNRYAWTAYLGHPPQPGPERPYAAAARREDLRGLPPAWIGVGDLDLFHDEDVDYALRLEAAGVPCRLRIEPGTYHAADSLLPDAGPSRAFRADLVEALAPHVSAGPVG